MSQMRATAEPSHVALPTSTEYLVILRCLSITVLILRTRSSRCSNFGSIHVWTVEEGVCAYSLSTLCSGPQGTPLRWHPSVFLNTVLLLLCVLPGGLLPGKPSFLHQTQKPT